MNGIIEESKETLTSMNRVETAFKQAGGSAKEGQKVYNDLYAVLGDGGRATEATQILSNLTTNQKDLSAYTKILTGVNAKWGDSLPVESLIEAVNETSKVGTVTGTLADALNWAGVSEDEFNAKLEKCTSEQQRQALIQKTLTGLYGEAGDAYLENNKELTALYDAENKNAQAMAKMSEKLMPVKTALIELGTTVIGKVTTGLTKFQEMLPTITGFIKEHKTEIIAVTSALSIIATGYALSSKGAGGLAVIMGGLRNVISGLSTAFQFLTTPTGLIVAAIALLVAGVIIAYKKCEGFRNIVNSMKDKLVEAWEAIKQGATDLKDKVGGAIDALKERFQPLTDAIKNNLVGAFYDLRNAFNELKAKLGELVEKFQPVIDIISGAFSSAFDDAKTKFGELKDKVLDFTEKALEKLNEKISTARQKFVEIREVVMKFLDKLEPLVTLIRDNLVTSLKNMKEPIDSIKKSFGTWFDTLKELGKALWEDIKPIFDLLMPIFKLIGGVVGGLLVVAFGNFMGMVNGLAKALSGIVKAVSGVFKIFVNIFKLVVGMFTGNAETIDEALKGIKDGVVDTFSGLWEAIKGYVSGFFEGIVGFFDGLLETITGEKGLVTKMIKKVVDFFKGLWDGIKDFVSSFKENVIAAFKFVKENTVGRFIEMKNKVVDTFVEFKQKIVDKVSEIKKKIAEKWDDIVDGAKKLPSRMAKGIDNMKTKFIDSVKNMFNTVISWVESGINKMINGINDLVGYIGIDLNLEEVSIPRLAKGTNNWQGGTALVGEAGRELVHDKGKTFMVNQPTLLNLGKGAKVLRNSKTESLLRKSGIPAFAKGKNESWFDEFKDNIWDYATNPSKIVDKLYSTLGFDENSSNVIFGSISKWVKNIKSNVTDMIKNMFGQAQIGRTGTGSIKDIEHLITSEFGYRNAPTYGASSNHKGIDIGFPAGTPIYSQSFGNVIASARGEKAGNYVSVRTPDGKTFKYLHMQSRSVKANDYVKLGDLLGYVGSTGVSTGAHLHFQVNDEKGNPINPRPYWSVTNLDDIDYGNMDGAKDAGNYYGLSGKYMKWANQALNYWHITGAARNQWLQAFGIVGKHESNFNQKAKNKNSTASGWLQFLDGTWKDYATEKGYTSKSSGLAQAITFVKYVLDRYGSPLNVKGVKDFLATGKYSWYGNGGLITQPTVIGAGERGAEAIVPLSNDRALAPFGKAVTNSLYDMLKVNTQAEESNGVYEIHTHVYLDKREIGVAVTPVVKEELDKKEARQARRKGRK